MEIYTQYYSTLSFNGKKILVDLRKWGFYTLSGNRLQQFHADLVECVNLWTSSGKVTVELVSSTSVDSNNNRILIGERITFQDNYFASDKWIYWQNEFKNDPNIVSFQPLVKQS